MYVEKEQRRSRNKNTFALNTCPIVMAVYIEAYDAATREGSTHLVPRIHRGYFYLQIFSHGFEPYR